MAIQYPMTMDELQKITGVGQGKATKFGQTFIELIGKYVVENEIDRPVDMVVKSAINKSGLKVFLIKCIDMKRPLDEVADEREMDMSDLINELEAIVFSGTKLNIDYYINILLDTDRQKELFDFFRTCETDNIKEIYNELSDEDYTEEEIRLTRIKFISEMGN